MKKATLICCFCLFAVGFSAFAQDESSNPHHVIVKWAPSGIYFGKISVGGEYNLTRKSALTLNFGIPFNKTLSHEIDDEKESLTHKTSSIMGGYRLYMGKGEGRGFYFEPYIKYLNYNASSVVDAELEGTSRDFAVNGKYTGVGAGIQLGAQFLIAKKFAIDFYFLGPEANSANTRIVMMELGNGAPWDSGEAADAEDEIQDVINDIPIIKNKAKVAVNPNQRTVIASYKGFLPGYRFGLSFGWKF